MGYDVLELQSEEPVTLRSIPPHLREHWPRWLLVAAVAVHIAMMGSLFWGYIDSWFNNSDVERQGLDFFSIYEAGHRVLLHGSAYGGPEHPRVPYLTFYRYVPLFAYVFGAPANLLPPWSAYWAWVSINELLLVVMAYATWCLAGRGTWATIGAAMWFVYTPFYQEQYFGQFSFLMGISIFWVGVALVRNSEGLGIVPWAVSLITKTNSALFGPVFVRFGWWRVLVGGAIALAVNLPYFWWRPRDLDYFRDANLSPYTHTALRFFTYIPGDVGGGAFVRNVYFAINTSATQVPGSYVLATACAVTAVSLVATLLTRKPDPLALFGIWGSIYFLTWVVWEHHYMMYLPVLVVLVMYRPQFRWWALAVFVLVAAPTPYWLLNHVWNTGPINTTTDPVFMHQNVWPIWGVLLYHAAKPGPVFALWAYLVVSQLRRGFDVTWMWDLLEPLRRLAALPAGSIRSRRSPSGVRPTSSFTPTSGSTTT